MPSKDIIIKKEIPFNTNPLYSSKPKDVRPPVNKTYKKYTKKKRSSTNNEKKDTNGVSIITCTKKDWFINNVFNNFTRQKIEKKELIIVLNTNKIDINKWKERAKSYDNIKIFQLSANKSLGECLNYGINKSKYNIIAKFDDDDYYSPDYLIESIDALKKKNCHVVGKGTTIVYFKSSKILALRTPGLEHRFVKFINGSTLVFNKEIFNNIKFHNVNTAEDVKFCRDCNRRRIKIYSTSKYNHVYIRYQSKTTHTWRISDKQLLQKHCSIITNTDDYISYADNNNL